VQTFRKNQIIITALVIMIAIAGYINFTEKTDVKPVINQDNGINQENIQTPTAMVPNENNTDAKQPEVKPDENNANDVSKVQQQPSEDAKTDSNADAKVDQNATKAEETSADNNSDSSTGEAVFINSNSVQSSHFLNAKIDREQTYSSLKEGYIAIIDNKELKEEQKTKAVKEMIDLQDRIEKEAMAESLLEAKGFEDVFVRISGGDVDVVINAEELSQAERAQVHDIVRRKTSVDPEKIHITLLDISKK
jgi:stage III sporulation protein AH